MSLTRGKAGFLAKNLLKNIMFLHYKYVNNFLFKIEEAIMSILGFFKKNAI